MVTIKNTPTNTQSTELSDERVIISQTPISIQDLPLKNTAQIDEQTALVMISETDTEDSLSSYTVLYSELVNTISNIANNIQGTPLTFYPALNITNNETITILVNSKRTYVFDFQNTEQGNLTINFEVANLNAEAYQLNLIFRTVAFPTSVTLQLNGNTTEQFNLTESSISTSIGTISNDILTTTPPTVASGGGNNTFFGLDDVNIPNVTTGQFLITNVDPLNNQPTVQAVDVVIPTLLGQLSDVSTVGGQANDLLGLVLEPAGLIWKPITPSSVDVTYESVLAVFAPNADNTNIDFGVYVDPLTALNKITLNFNTYDLEQAITAALNAAKQYTDEQIAGISTTIPPVVPLPIITVPMETFTNNTTNQWTNIAAYSGAGPIQILQPTNNYVLNYTFNNGKIVGTTNAGVIVPQITTNNINLYMMCPIFLDTSLLSSDYIYVTINLIVTNRYTGTNAIGNQAFNIYLGNPNSVGSNIGNYLNHIQPTGTSLPFRITYQEFSPTSYAVGNSWTITRTFAINKLNAVLVNNPTTITFPYVGQNFCGSPPNYLFVNWTDIQYGGLPAPNVKTGPFGIYASSTNLWTQQYTKFATSLEPNLLTNIIMDFDFSTVTTQIVSSSTGGDATTTSSIYNTCWLFLDTNNLTTDYQPVNLTLNYRIKLPLAGSAGWSNYTPEFFLSVVLGVPGNNVPSAGSKLLKVFSRTISTITFAEWPFQGVIQGTYKKTIYINKTSWTDVNPNQIFAIQEAIDADIPPTVEFDTSGQLILAFDPTTKLFTTKNLFEIGLINYGEAEVARDYPDFDPVIGGNFTDYSPYGSNSFPVKAFNYNLSLTYKYFVSGLSDFPTIFNLSFDEFEGTQTIDFNIKIDNSRNSEKLTIYFGGFFRSSGSTFPPSQSVEGLAASISILQIPPASIGYFNFRGNPEYMIQIGSQIIGIPEYIIDFIGVFGLTAYMEKYTDDVNRVWRDSGYFCNFTRGLGGVAQGGGFAWNYYANINQTPTFNYGGDTACFLTFFPTHPYRGEFWKFKTYTVAFKRGFTVFEDFLQNANENLITPKNNLYPRMARIKMKTPFTNLTEMFDNTENSWEKECGYLRNILKNDPSNLLDYIDEIEIYGWDGIKQKVYLTYKSSVFDPIENQYKPVSTYEILGTEFSTASDTTFSFVADVNNNNDLERAPYYQIMPKNLTNQRWLIGQRSETALSLLPITSTVNIDRPPIFLQGLLELTFDAFDQLTGMSFVKPFNLFSSVENGYYPYTFTFPDAIFGCNFTHYEEPRLPRTLWILSYTGEEFEPLPYGYAPPEFLRYLGAGGYLQSIESGAFIPS